MYRLQVASKETGAADVLFLEAESPAAATALANEQGWLVSMVEDAPPIVLHPPIQKLASPPFVPPTMTGSTDERILAQLEQLNQAEIFTRPAWTIARGLLLYGLVCGALFLIGWGVVTVVGMLGVGIVAKDPERWVAWAVAAILVVVLAVCFVLLIDKLLPKQSRRMKRR